MIGHTVSIDFPFWREIGGEIVNSTVEISAKFYRGELEFYYNTPGSEQLTPAEWERAEEKLYQEAQS